MKYGLFFGDSITYGEYDGVFGGWVDIVKRYALQKYNEGSNELILFTSPSVVSPPIPRL